MWIWWLGSLAELQRWREPPGDGDQVDGFGSSARLEPNVDQLSSSALVLKVQLMDARHQSN